MTKKTTKTTKTVKTDSFSKIQLELLSLKTLVDVARILPTKPNVLSHILYIKNGGRENSYTDYTIPKKNGKKRKISAPNDDISFLQYRLDKILRKIYSPRPSAHAFLEDRSIKTNALNHVGKRWILNLDLEDFFGTITFPRVRGMFMAAPYNLNADVATIFAQIACYKGAIPQGGRTSPIISNMICSRLDGELQRFAKENRCTYTRYADDISFSTNLKVFPESIATGTEDVTLSSEIEGIVKNNGFTINYKKVHLQNKNYRQVVTGLVVNEYVNVNRRYIRNVRSALHQWETLGIEKASVDYFDKFCPDSRLPEKKDQTKKYKRIFRGKIEFIKSIKSDTSLSENETKIRLKVFYKFLKKYFLNSIRDGKLIQIRTEGKTDWMHFEMAYKTLKSSGHVKDIGINFFHTKEHFFYGSGELLTFCKMAESNKIRPFLKKVICIFDSDEDHIKAFHKTDYKVWGGNVYSVVLEKKSSKGSCQDLCIENLYSHADITRKLKGKRLFLSDEFNQNGYLKIDSNIKYEGPLKVLAASKNKVIDANVIDQKTGERLSISKYQFARAIYNKEPGFEKVDFSQFKHMFDPIEQVTKLP